MADEIKLAMPRDLVEFINARANSALRSKLTDDERANFRNIVNFTFRALNASPGFFVWIKAANKVGFACQVWPTGMQQLNQKPVPVLQKHELTTLELKLPLSQLMEIYPYAPQDSEENKAKLHAPIAEGTEGGDATG